MFANISKLWVWASNLGVKDGMSEEELRNYRLLNKLTVPIVLVQVITIIIKLFLQVDWVLIVAELAILFVTCIIIYYNYIHKHLVSTLVLSLVFPFVIFCLVIGYGKDGGSDYLYIPLIVLGIFFHKDKRLRIGVVIWALFLYLIGEFHNAFFQPLILNVHSNLDKNISFLVAIMIVTLLNDMYIREKNTYENKLIDTLKNLEIKNQALNVANQELERFAYIASHDLKSPVRTIVSYLDLIDKKIDKKEYDDLKNYINFAKTGGKQMNNLISEILEYTTLNFTENIEIEDIDLNDLTLNNVANLQIILDNKNAEVLIGHLPTIRANRLLTGLLFQNLIENAVKYNESKVPQVQINAQIEQDKIHIIFKDNGIGIEPQFHEKIFDLFTRLHANHTYSGSGLGLAICKKIAERMSGTIRLESSIHNGSSFIISLPN